PDTAAERVSLVLPAEEVLGLQAPRVARSRAALALALPFAIEEQLAAPVETLHVAFDGESSGERVALAVTDAARLRQRLDALAEAGLAVDACHAEWQLLPGEGPRLWLEHGRALLSDGARALCLPESDLLPLTDWLRQAGFDPSELPRLRPGGAQQPGEQGLGAALPELARG